MNQPQKEVSAALVAINNLKSFGIEPQTCDLILDLIEDVKIAVEAGTEAQDSPCYKNKSARQLANKGK